LPGSSACRSSSAICSSRHDNGRMLPAAGVMSGLRLLAMPPVYHETFWVTVGTAAPVIALATVVSLPELISMRRLYILAEIANAGTVDPADYSDIARFWQRDLRSRVTASGLLTLLGVANLLLQALTLAAALSCLALRSDDIPLLAPVIIEPIGVLTLAATSAAVLSLKSTLQDYQRDAASRRAGK
jgi:hypothetical protein